MSEVNLENPEDEDVYFILKFISGIAYQPIPEWTAKVFHLVMGHGFVEAAKKVWQEHLSEPLLQQTENLSMFIRLWMNVILFKYT